MPRNHTMITNHRDSIDEIISQIRQLRKELQTGPVSRAQLQRDTRATNSVMAEYEFLFKDGRQSQSKLPPPPGKDELGRGTWTLLHTMAAYWPEKPPPEQAEDGKSFIELLSRLYPCTDCAAHFRETLTKYPPTMGSQKEFMQWISFVHNRINKRLGKQHFHTSDHQKRWWNPDSLHGDE